MSSQPGKGLASKYLGLARHAAVFGLGSLGNRLLGLLLLPLYTSYLTPADYGVLAIIATTSAFLGVVMQSGMSTSIFRHYFVQGDTQKTRQAAIWSALVWLMATGAGAVAVLWWPAPRLAYLLLGSADYANYLRISLLSLAAANLDVVPYAYLRAEKKSAQYAAYSSVGFVGGAALNIYFVAFAQLGIQGILIATLIKSVLFSIAGLIMARRVISPMFSRSMLVSMLRFGLPLVVPAIGSVILVRADRYFLARYTTMAVVGLYSLAYSLGVLVNNLLVQPFQLIWLPAAFEMQNQTGARRFYTGALTYLLLVLGWCGLAISLLSREVLQVATAPSFHSAYVYVPWIAMSYVVYGAYMCVNVGIYLERKTSYAPLMVGTSAILNLVADFVLISRWGGYGAAVATFISYLWLLLMALLVNHKVFPLRYEWGRIAHLAAVTIGLLAFGLLVPGSLLVRVLAKTSLLAAFWIVLLATKFFRREELAVGWAWLRRLQVGLLRFLRRGRQVAAGRAEGAASAGTQISQPAASRSADVSTPKICILSFSTISRDCRVLRQAEYASREFAVDVIGYGEWTPPWPRVQYHALPVKRLGMVERRVCSSLLVAGALHHGMWKLIDGILPDRRVALELLQHGRYDLIHANDLAPLPVAASAAKETGSKLIFDAHEYVLDQGIGLGKLGAFHRLKTSATLRESIRDAHASVTVSPGIADLYRRDLGVQMHVILNTPPYAEVPHRPPDEGHIGLVHHGGASSRRGLERLIEMMQHLDNKFSLNFVLLDTEDTLADRERLMLLADAIAPGRVFFFPPVPPDRIVQEIARFDIGVHMLPPAALNHKDALPNKLFDYIMAGLAVGSGPSPEMARIITTYDVGVIASGFEPLDLAQALNGLSTEELDRMRSNSLKAARILNAEVEMGKLVDLYRSVLTSLPSAPKGDAWKPT